MRPPRRGFSLWRNRAFQYPGTIRTSTEQVPIRKVDPSGVSVIAVSDSRGRRDTILRNLLHALPEGGLEAGAMEGSRSVTRLFTHIHKVAGPPHNRNGSGASDVGRLDAQEGAVLGRSQALQFGRRYQGIGRREAPISVRFPRFALRYLLRYQGCG